MRKVFLLFAAVALLAVSSAAWRSVALIRPAAG